MMALIQKLFSVIPLLHTIKEGKKHLTRHIKTNHLSFFIKRDGGFKCFYCGKPLKLNYHIYEHLDDQRDHNYPENWVLSCQSCNNKKPHSLELKRKAREKLRQNEMSKCVREKISENEDVTKEASPEIEINKVNYEITKQYLAEVIETDSYVLFSEALHACTYQCKEKTEHGSQQSVRNYIATLTSIVSPFMIVRDENKRKIIVKREDKLLSTKQNDNLDDNLRGEK